MAVAVTDKRGMKRICTSCGTRFYDMNKRPIHCPGCQTEFTGETKSRGRRGRVAANEDDVVKKPAKGKIGPADSQVSDDEITDAEDDDMVVSLEEVEEMEEAEDEDALAELDDDIEGDLEEIEDLGDIDDLEEDEEADDEEVVEDAGAEQDR